MPVPSQQSKMSVAASKFGRVVTSAAVYASVTVYCSKMHTLYQLQLCTSAVQIKQMAFPVGKVCVPGTRHADRAAEEMERRYAETWEQGVDHDSPTLLTYVPKMLLVSFESLVFGHVAHEKAHTLNIR